MAVRFSELQCKEVICVSDGRRLGFIVDVDVVVPEGSVCAIIVPGPWLQKRTTKEPTDDQIEVAIRALNEVRPDRENVKEA